MNVESGGDIDRMKEGSEVNECLGGEETDGMKAESGMNECMRGKDTLIE